MRRSGVVVDAPATLTRLLHGLSPRLRGGGLAGIAIVSLPAPKLAFADEKTVAAEIKKLYGDKPIASGKIKLDVPEIELVAELLEFHDEVMPEPGAKMSTHVPKFE